MQCGFSWLYHACIFFRLQSQLIKRRLMTLITHYYLMHSPYLHFLLAFSLRSCLKLKSSWLIISCLFHSTVIHIFQILFPYRLLQNIECNFPVLYSRSLLVLIKSWRATFLLQGVVQLYALHLIFVSLVFFSPEWFLRLFGFWYFWRVLINYVVGGPSFLVSLTFVHN